MFDYNNIIKTAILSSLSACALLACVEVEQPRSTESGYLSAPSLDIDVEVEDLTQTKALDFGIQAPDPSQMHFVVKDKDDKVVYDAEGLWVDPLVLPVGQYTIDAYAGENGFGAPYFMGTVTGSISALDSEVPALSVALANALVNVNVSDALAEHFIKDDRLSLNGNAYEAAYGEWFYVPAGADLSLELTGTNSAGKQVKFSHTLKSPSPKAAYRITCGTETTDWPSISLSLSEDDAWASRIYITTPASFSGNISAENQAAVVYEAIPAASSDWTAPATAVPENGVMVIKGLVPGTEYQVRARVGALVSPVEKVTPSIDGLSVTAAHTSTSGELDGTDVTPTFSKSAAVSNAIQSWKLDICKADGTVLRTQTDLGKSDGSAITATDGWPYLPVGSYKVMALATMSDGEEVRVQVPFTTQNPVFTLTPACKTTYDYYLAGDMFNANAEPKSKTAEAATYPNMSLYEIGSSVSISSNLMRNTNYNKSVYYAAMKDSEVVISTDGYVDFGTSKSHTVGDVTDKFTDWRTYVLSVKMNFAGTEITATRNFHITGLPYSAAPPKIQGSYAWAFNGGTLEIWDGNDQYAKLGNGASGTSSMTSPYFHVPRDFKVNISSKYYVKCDNFFGGKNIFTLSLGNEKVQETTVKGANNTSEEYSSDANMTTTNNYIVCSNSYGLGSSHTKIYYINVKYK